MTHFAGIAFALIALVSWGLGDFYIQKTTRVVGSWKALFFIGVVGFIGLFPFIKNDLSTIRGVHFLTLGLLGVVVICTALFDFEALRQGKIAIIEPIIGLELPMTVGLSLVLVHEALAPLQLFLVGIVFIGIILAITTDHTHLYYHKKIFERGVILASVGALGMAVTNFLVGVSSQAVSPLITIWCAHSLLVLVSGTYLFCKGEFGSLIQDVRRHPRPIIGQSILDNMAWVSFAKATTLIPIAIATTISESYIALAVLLGLFVNHEKLKRHQIVGIILSTIGVMAISSFS